MPNNTITKASLTLNEQIEMRQVERVEVRQNEGIHADIIFIELKNKPVLRDVRVYDLSTMGASIIINTKNLREFEIELNKVLLIDLHVGLSSSYRLNYTVVSLHPFQDEQSKVGLSYRPKQKIEDLFFKEFLPTDFPLMGYLYKSHFFYEKASFRTLSITTKSMMVEVQDSGMFLLPGSIISCFLYLPIEGKKEVVAKVIEVFLGENGYLKLELEIIDFPYKLQEAITDYLLWHVQLSTDFIRQIGFRSKKFANSLKVKSVKNDEEYLETLELRKKSYQLKGKLKLNTQVHELALKNDETSRILSFYHHDKIVASAALSFSKTTSNNLETTRYVTEDISHLIPINREVMEVSRLCVDPSYQGGDIVNRMFEHIYRIFIMSKVPYILTSADDKMLGVYKKIGFRQLGISYIHPHFKTKHEIIMVDRETPLIGKNISPIIWSFFYQKMTHFIIERGAFRPNFKQGLRIKAYELIGCFMVPLFKWFLELKRSFKKKLH